MNVGDDADRIGTGSISKGRVVHKNLGRVPSNSTPQAIQQRVAAREGVILSRQALDRSG